MKYQIDQSGKIEQTNRMTVVAIANGKFKTIKISAVEKQKLIKTMIALDFPLLNYMQKIFATMIFILLKDIALQEVVIDKEYPAHEPDIKNIILNYFRKSGLTPPEISFKLVGKRSKAHILGISVFRKMEKPDLTISAEDLLEVMYGKANKKGWRSRSSRDNP